MDISSDIIPYKLYFTPNDPTTQNIIKNTVTTFKISGSRGFDTEAEMISHFNAEDVFAGIVLNDFNMTLRFPNYFRTQYKKKSLRMIDFWLTRCSGYQELDKLENLKHVDFYVREGFLQLYDHLLKAKYNTDISLEKTLKILATFNMMSMSSLYHDADPEVGCVNNIDRRGLTAEGFLNSFLYSFLYFVPFLHLVWKFSSEREENIFAHNWLYGYSYEAQRYAHYIISFLHFLLLDIIVLLCIMATWHPVMPLQQIFLIFTYIVMYSVLLIIYAMALSTLLANARAAVWCGACLWIATYAVFTEVLTLITLDVTQWKIIIIFTIFFNNMLASGVFYLKEYKHITASTAIAMLVMQLFVLVIYICVLKIIDFAKPGPYIKNIWLGNKCRKQIKKDVPDFNTQTLEDNIEYGHLSGQILKLDDVSSVRDFSPKLDGDLKNISMKFFKNEISVLVAPHGSGKTTLIAILAGWQDHQGQIRFYRNDEKIDNWLNYRQYVDVAMPNNALYDELTVKETLRYFIATKQLKENRHEMENEIEKWLKILRVSIEDCDKKRVKHLSFGQKRLLVLCCTLSCNTPVVLLDEPTLHMKADHQHAFWEILNSEKSERAIIITTCSIDEANEIGDRIGIMYKGHLMAYGSSFYLRTRFGKGFYLICLIQPMKPVYPITQLIKKFIPNVQLHQQFNDRVIYLLPADKKAFYQRVLIELEKEYTTLGISNVYVTGSHLNDVYMAMTREPDINNYNNLPDLKNTLKFLQDKKPDLKKCPETAIFHKKLYCQAKNSLPLWAIFISWFLIHALSQVSLDYLNDTVIVFANGIKELPSEQPHIEIRNVRDLKHGLFIYDNIESVNSSLHKKMVALRPADPIIYFHMNEKVFHTAMLSFHAAYIFKGYEMTVINKPVKLISNRGLHLTLGIIMPLTMCMVFVALTEERFNFMMALQRIAGLKDRQFWIMSFMWDYTIYLLISLVYLVIIISDAFRWEKLLAAYVLFMCGMLSLTFIYLMTLFFDETHCVKAYFKILCIHLVIGILPYVLYINAIQYYLYFEYVFYILMLSPGFAILHGTSKIFNNNEHISLDEYFQWDYPGFLDSIFFLTLTAFILAMKFLIVFIARKRHMQSTPKK
ncbi:hypothetical protein DOY81_003318 [Sarcophaga bullata]|nr:hypothetical protein DOY81_003318 [Sarcophaga bullata]